MLFLAQNVNCRHLHRIYLDIDFCARYRNQLIFMLRSHIFVIVQESNPILQLVYLPIAGILAKCQTFSFASYVIKCGSHAFLWQQNSS